MPRQPRPPSKSRGLAKGYIATLISRGGPSPVQISIRLESAEFTELAATAASLGISLTALIRHRLSMAARMERARQLASELARTLDGKI